MHCAAHTGSALVQKRADTYQVFENAGSALIQSGAGASLALQHLSMVSRVLSDAELALLAHSLRQPVEALQTLAHATASGVLGKTTA